MKALRLFEKKLTRRNVSQDLNLHIKFRFFKNVLSLSSATPWVKDEGPRTPHTPKLKTLYYLTLHQRPVTDYYGVSDGRTVRQQVPLRQPRPIAHEGTGG
jgi:hypothetical protein